MRIRSFLVFLLFLPQIVWSDPSDPAPSPTLGSTAKNTFSPGTLGRDFISPVITPARTALLIGTGATLLTLALRRDVEEPFNDWMKHERPLGRNHFGDVIGQLVPNAAYFAYMLGDYGWTGDPKSLRRADAMFRTTLHAGAMTIVLKSLFRSGRPYDPHVKTSFPSGHTSSSFAFASAVAMEHEWYWGASAYALASYVSLSRINDHQHHLRDVIAGATLGISYGLGIYYRIQSEQARDGNSTVRIEPREPRALWAFVPTDDLQGGAFLYRATFR